MLPFTRLPFDQDLFDRLSQPADFREEPGPAAQPAPSARPLPTAPDYQDAPTGPARGNRVTVRGGNTDTTYLDGRQVAQVDYRGPQQQDQDTFRRLIREAQDQLGPSSLTTFDVLTNPLAADQALNQRNAVISNLAAQRMGQMTGEREAQARIQATAADQAADRQNRLDVVREQNAGRADPKAVFAQAWAQYLANHPEAVNNPRTLQRAYDNLRSTMMPQGGGGPAGGRGPAGFAPPAGVGGLANVGALPQQPGQDALIQRLWEKYRATGGTGTPEGAIQAVAGPGEGEAGQRIDAVFPQFQELLTQAVQDANAKKGAAGTRVLKPQLGDTELTSFLDRLAGGVKGPAEMAEFAHRVHQGDLGDVGALRQKLIPHVAQQYLAANPPQPSGDAGPFGVRRKVYDPIQTDAGFNIVTQMPTQLGAVPANLLRGLGTGLGLSLPYNQAVVQGTGERFPIDTMASPYTRDPGTAAAAKARAEAGMSLLRSLMALQGR